MNNLPLFLDFHFGDLFGEGSDLQEDVMLAILTAFLSGFVVVLGINYEKCREKRKHTKELRFLLFNLHIHLKQILIGAQPIPEDYYTFVTNISKARLDSNIAQRNRRRIPELGRILQMDNERILQSFLVTFKDKDLGAVDCNRVYTCVEYLKEVLEKLQLEYDDSMQIRYLEMQKFNDILIEIQRQLGVWGILLKKDVSSLIKGAIETNSSNMEDYLNKFLIPTENFLKDCKPQAETHAILHQIGLAKESLKFMHLRTLELENLLKENVPEVTRMIEKIQEIDNRIIKDLSRYIKINKL